MDPSNSDTSVHEKTVHPAREKLWWAAAGLIVSTAALLRFYELNLKPLHHDEGVNGFFLTTLFREGIYKYDPANYHGPTLYYIALAFTRVFGLETTTIRASVAVFGVLTVVLTLCLRKYIGSLGSLFAALLVALSPGMVFISRYFIHEIFFVFLSLAIALSILYFIERREAGVLSIGWMSLILLVAFLPSTLNIAAAIAGQSTISVWVLRGAIFAVECILVFLVMRMLVAWNGGRPIYLLLASACAALFFATKETAFITVGVMLIACICVWLWRRLYGSPFNDSEDDDISDSGINWQRFSNGLGTTADRILIFTSVTVVFVYLGILFFSSFFTYPAGLSGAVEAYTLWSKTGSKDHTQNGMWAYLIWALKLESPILILSVLGSVIAFARARHRFALFSALWAFGLLAAYTLIPYKTPWLALSFLLPMCIAAGYGINEIARSRNVAARVGALLLAAASVGIMSYQTYQLNFVRYDDAEMPYVYAHTSRDFLVLIERIGHYADKSQKGNEATIDIVSPDYWPMVWYLRDYSHANFHGHLVDPDSAEMIIAKKDEQDSEVIRRYSAAYRNAGIFALRPGVELVLLVRRDLAEDGASELYRLEDP